VWTPITYQSGWSDYGSGYPPGEFLVDRNVVRFRGVLKPGTTTEGTEFFSIPSQYGVPVSQQVFAIATVFGQPTALGLRIAAVEGGTFLIFAMGTCTGIAIDSMSYFYKY
jgi:hypothetical protein